MNIIYELYTNNYIYLVPFTLQIYTPVAACRLQSAFHGRRRRRRCVHGRPSPQATHRRPVAGELDFLHLRRSRRADLNWSTATMKRSWKGKVNRRLQPSTPPSLHSLSHI